ncbi:thermonuclease family protein [Sphingomonas mesophila]|uniref:thermonuclease family protein n=1 Tax=Sphingomonas mesophila TaxID=2303576 RepID=UPI000E58DE71|nr:thermonuclease family protein [Sphingomonas mesophila]
MPLQPRFIIAPDTPEVVEDTDFLWAKPTKVFDGDGFAADVWHPVREKWLPRVPFRFAFIDAPEMKQPFGPEAQQALHHLIGGRKLRVDPIVKESSPDLPLDQYKRLLCMAYVTEELGEGHVAYFVNGKAGQGMVRNARTVTRNIELEMIVNGWAWVVTQYSFDREEEYFSAQHDARRHRRGLWATENPEAPWAFKQRQKRQRQSGGRHSRLPLNRCGVATCDGALVEREGAHGRFLGCSNFPQCRYRQPI